MQVKFLCLAFILCMHELSGQIVVVQETERDTAILNRYIRNLSSRNIPYSYFYALYWNRMVGSLTEGDSLYSGPFLSQPHTYPYQTSNVVDTTDHREYRSGGNNLTRAFKNRQLENSRMHFNFGFPRATELGSLQYNYHGLETRPPILGNFNIPYYMKENRYQRMPK